MVSYTFVITGASKAAPFSLRTSAYPVAKAHPCSGVWAWIVSFGWGGGGKRGFSFSPPGGSLGHFPTGVPAWRTARRAFPVTSTVPRAACWPGASTQVTKREARASGAGVARPPGAGVARAPASGLTAGPGAGTAPPPGVVAGPGAGTAALPAVNVTERPAAVSATSPGEDAVTGGTVP